MSAMTSGTDHRGRSSTARPEEVSNIYKPYHNLAYTGDNIEDYAEIANYAKVRGGEASMQRIVEALKSVEEGKDIDEHVDIESVMKYMALQTIVVNYDCMTGPNVQNYYLREADVKNTSKAANLSRPFQA